MQRDLLVVNEMIDAAEQAVRLVSGADLQLLRSDRQLRDALLWNFTVLGEASSQLDARVKQQHPDIPWAQPARLRNRIIHGYWSVDLEILHTTATDLLPGLILQLREVVAALESEDSGSTSGADGAG